MKDRHQRIEHLGRYSFVDVFILLIVHMLCSASRNSTFENIISESFDLLLITNSIFVINIFALVILIQTFSIFMSFFHHRYGPIIWGCHTIVTQLTDSSAFNQRLYILKLDVSIKRHVRHHYSYVFRRDESIVIKIIPIIEQKINN